MSPFGFSLKFSKYVCLANLSISDEKTHLPPISSKGILRPPIPENKSIKVNLIVFKLII